MASIHCSVSVPSFPKLRNHAYTNANTVRFFSLNPIRASTSSSSSPTAGEAAMSVDNLRRFIHLNMGKWKGSFYQFDSCGNLLQQVSTKLAASSYGDDELMSLIQTLYIKQPSSSTSISGDDAETEWAEYKIKETNMFTVDKYQQFADRLFPI